MKECREEGEGGSGVDGKLYHKCQKKKRKRKGEGENKVLLCHFGGVKRRVRRESKKREMISEIEVETYLQIILSVEVELTLMGGFSYIRTIQPG